MLKMGWFGMDRGHSRSWAMPPFDRAHTTSYTTLIETMCLSFAVFEIWPVISQKLPTLTHPTCVWRPRMGGVIPVEFRGDLWHQKKIDSLSYRVEFFVSDPTFSPFSTTPTCDRQTDTGPWLVPRMHSIAR